MPFTSYCLRIAPLAAVLLCLAGTAGAESGNATDAAYGALLAMPGVQPREGGWLIPEQAEPVPEDEDELIARLRRLKQAGANFNAIRHRGTLLAHAIRAGKDRTALWLLRNGADPKHVLFSDSVTACDLARRFNRTAVIKVLENQYGFKPPTQPKTGVGAPKAPATPETPSQSREQQAIALMTRLVGPTLIPSEAGQREWKEFAATLSPAEYIALFKDGANLENLVRLVQNTEGGLEYALSRLPPDLVRRKAQVIADLLAKWSFVTYSHDPKIRYTASSHSWPALWRRIDQPLSYEQRPDLAEHIPPAQWPGLFASGYSKHDAEVTGCQLSMVDVAAFKALWPDFQRFFADAREKAPALVLGKYRLARRKSPCYYDSSPADTVAKLAFLLEQGVTSPVAGLRKSLLDEENNPALAAMAATFSPQTQTAPRLVKAPLACELALNDAWLDALINVRGVGWGIPAEYVQAIDVPGQGKCGLIVSGDRYTESAQERDDFFYGPAREGSTRCADSPDDGEIWVEEAGQIRNIKMNDDRCEGGCTLRKVLDMQTGKQYLLNGGIRGALCSQSQELPDAFEWQTRPQGLALLPSRDGGLVDRLLREQCQESPGSGNLVCRGINPLGENGDEAKTDGEEVVATLRKGGVVTIEQLVDLLGAGRRGAYGAAIAAHDRAQIRRLHAAGIPPRWTAAEISALGRADLPLAEKRRRIALLFADRDQLDRTLNKDRYDLPEALLGWLPDEDWKPVLSVIGRHPDLWLDPAGRLRNLAAEANRLRLACDIDRAQGFLCGGGIRVD